MAIYFSAVADDLLPALRSGENLPAGLHFNGVIGRIASSAPMMLVEFDDDDAPAELEGLTVTLAIQSHRDSIGRVTHTTVLGRTVDKTPYLTAT